MKEAKTMYGEVDTMLTDDQVAASIPKNEGNNYVKLPEGVVPFESSAYFKSKLKAGMKEATCEMLILPFGVDEYTLKLLPPAYTDNGYLKQMHWKLDYFAVHSWVNTTSGIRSFVCPQSVGSQRKGTCPMCDLRAEVMNEITPKGEKWDLKKMPEEYGSVKPRSSFLAYIDYKGDGTDNIYYVEQRTVWPKTADNDKAPSSVQKTFFEILKRSQSKKKPNSEDFKVPQTKFYAESLKGRPSWLRIDWEVSKFPKQDGTTGIMWNPIDIEATDVSLNGIAAKDVTFEHLGDNAYNPCYMLEFLTKEEIEKIADSVCPKSPKKDKAEKTDDEPCWDDIADLDVGGLLLYAKKHKMDVSCFDPSTPKGIVRAAIMDFLNITRPE